MKALAKSPALVETDKHVKMPKKKGPKNKSNSDFTINDCANALKPVGKLKKSVVEPAPAEVSWEQLQDDDYDIIEEISEDGTKNFVYKKKKRNNSKSEPDTNNERPGNVYPEIVWYHISKFMNPEDVGRFAGINKVTYALTQRETFWRLLYKKYCENDPKLPERLRLENSFKVYGLRQRVIRALYHTYHVFVKKVLQQAAHDSQPHLLVKRRCVNVWFCKGPLLWSIYFKLKKQRPLQRIGTTGLDFIEELGRVDANPEDDSQVMQVTCQDFYEVPPLMGMILTSINVGLYQGFQHHHRIRMGFNSGYHVTRDIQPEHTIVLDSVISILVFDWWHPKYPHFDNRVPLNFKDDEALPMLKRDFFAIQEAEL